MQRDDHVYENESDYLKALAARALEVYIDHEVGQQGGKCSPKGKKIKRLFSAASHLQDMQNLNNALQHSDGSPSAVKKIILAALTREYEKPMTRWQRKKYGDVIVEMHDIYAIPFHQFLNKLNSEPTKHHYSRLLCVLLNKTNQVIGANIENYTKKHEFNHDPYVKFDINIPNSYSKLNEITLAEKPKESLKPK